MHISWGLRQSGGYDKGFYGNWYIFKDKTKPY